jgi:hypothetical protein
LPVLHTHLEAGQRVQLHYFQVDNSNEDDKESKEPDYGDNDENSDQEGEEKQEEQTGEKPITQPDQLQLLAMHKIMSPTSTIMSLSYSTIT